jgi:hypothetical protein
MGFIQAAVAALDKSSEAAAKEVRASLDMLDSLSASKKLEMDVALKERTEHAVKQKEIPPGTSLFDASECHVVTSKGPAEGIKSALSGLLQNAEENWKQSVGELVNTALNAMLGGAAGGSTTKTYYIIALDGHAADPSKTPPVEETYVPVRIDYSLWVYNFNRTGITDMAQSAVVYRARKATLDYDSIPSSVQLEQILKNIGLPKAQRDELRALIEADATKRNKNLRAYLDAEPNPEVRTRLRSLL